MHVGFGLLTISATFNIFSDELGKARPPIVGCHELAGFQVSQVASRGVVMAAEDNVMAKGPVGGIYTCSW